MCSGYLIRAGDDCIVFDHGFGAHHRLLELGVRATEVTHLIFTHLHYDHIGDYPRLLLTRWDQGGGCIPELRVYGPPPLKAITASFFSPTGAFGLDLRARTVNECSLNLYRARGGVGERRPPAPEVTELAADAEIDAGAWHLRVAEVVHFAPILTCYAYRLEHAGQSLVYSGDTGPSDSLRRLAHSCDVLIHMCHYYSGTAPSKEFARSCTGHLELAELAEDAHVKTLVLTHVTEQLDAAGMNERVVAEMSAIYKGNIVVGADLMKIPFGPVAPGRLD
jgi:ribonuclease BN (tRNA processing enzyme)